MRAPDFWRHDGALSRLLTPVAWAYGAGVRALAAGVSPYRAPVPVLCVGNLVAGGAGKTPTALALAKALRIHGRNPGFLTRGYRGRLAGPIRVDPRRHRVHDVGDEPLLLAAAGPTWVSRDRPAGAKAAADAGADVIVMDDGLQNDSLIKDLSIVVVDGGFGCGNGRTIPAGPLREPVARGLARADAIVVIDRPLQADELKLPPLPPGIPVLHARLEPSPKAARFRDKRVVAFAGIGHPEKFFQTMQAVGAQVVAAVPFGDHQTYSPEDIMRMVEIACAQEAELVTTAKDYVRLPPEARAMVEVVNVSLEFDTPQMLDPLLHTLLEGERRPYS